MTTVNQRESLCPSGRRQQPFADAEMPVSAAGRTVAWDVTRRRPALDVAAYLDMAVQGRGGAVGAGRRSGVIQTAAFVVCALGRRKTPGPCPYPPVTILTVWPAVHATIVMMPGAEQTPRMGDLIV